MKFWASLIISMFFAISVFAGGTTFTILSDTLNSPDDTTSDAVRVNSYDKLSFIVKYDETEVGGGVSGVLTFDVSSDGTNWIDASFHDFTGGATLQTSETFTADADYFCWFDRAWSFTFMRAQLAGTATDADDTIAITVKSVGTR